MKHRNEDSFHHYGERLTTITAGGSSISSGSSAGNISSRSSRQLPAAAGRPPLSPLLRWAEVCILLIYMTDAYAYSILDTVLGR